MKVKISKYQVGEQKFDQFLKPEWFFSIKLVSKAIHFQVMGCGRAEIQKRRTFLVKSKDTHFAPPNFQKKTLKWINLTILVAKNHKNCHVQPFWFLDVDFYTKNCQRKKFEGVQNSNNIMSIQIMASSMTQMVQLPYKKG